MMEGSQGMVAVVRGLRDAGLAVTLLDGNRQYTLMPNYVPNTSTSANTSPESAPVRHNVPQRTQQCQQTEHQGHNANMSTDSVGRCESGSQATDGRYASMYKTAHCNVSPTSPPMHLSEFPPQRTQLNRGHGNFQVGGTGSGDTGHPHARTNDSYRGAMCWPDRGSVCVPRPSQEIDAFANSLRKYPSMSPERSTEIVERLISYTQNKNAAKSLQTRNQLSPTRIPDTYSTTQNLEHSSRDTSKSRRNYEPDVKVTPRNEEAPTRDIRCRMSESPNRAVLGKALDIRYIRDNMSKRVREIRYSSCYPYQQVIPNFRERYDHSPEHTKRPLQGTNSVNMEIQAGVKMVSREVATVPRVDPPKKSVAVSHSTSLSAPKRVKEGRVSQIPDKQTPLELSDFFKSAQTALYPITQLNLHKSIKTTLSFTETNNRWRCNENVRKTKSQVELKVEFNEDIICLLRNVVLEARSNKNALAPIAIEDNVLNTRIEERFRFHIGWCDDERPKWCHCGHFNDTGHRPRKRMRTDDSICVYRAEITPLKLSTIDDELENVIKTWVNTVEIKPRDFFGRPVDRNDILNLVTNRLKFLINGRTKCDVFNNLKAEIIDIVKSIPIVTRGHSSRWLYMNNVVNALFNEVKRVYNDDYCKSANKFVFASTFSNVDNNSSRPLFKFRKYIQPTEEELKQFIVIEMMELMEKYNLTIKLDNWDDFETELTDILLDSMEAIRRNDVSEVENQIKAVLIEEGGISQHHSILVANTLIKNFKVLFSVINTGQMKNNSISQTFVVMPGLNNSKQYQLNTNESFDFSIGGISDRDIEANFNAYMNQLAQYIDDWLIKLQLPGVDEKGRHVVVKDLAGDIVDRQKYLELNPESRGSNNNELKHLKYQIFKWVNKLTGDDSTLAVQNAPELMQKIQSIPVPMLTRPNGGDSGGNVSNISMFSPTRPGASIIETGGRRNSNRRFSSSRAFAAGPKPIFGQAGQDGSILQPGRDVISNRRQSYPGEISYRPMQVINEATDYTDGQINGSAQNLNTNTEVGVGTSATPGSQTNVTLTPTFKETNDEYEAFLNSWVQEIPIDATTPQEKVFADKARQGVLNGVWKSIAKVRSNPDKYHDTFHIQDVLDDDIEELLDLLPQSQELVSKKFSLKNKLITKTTGTTKKLKLLIDPSCYKEELIDKFLMVWPRRTVTKTDDEDPIKLFEELQALKLVEDFILYIRYQNDDKVKANVYKNKLLRNAKELVAKVKDTHGKELQDISTDAYVTDIFTALHKVPIPNDETINEEADEILLGLEVDQWYTDLPLVESDDPEEHLKRRRLRDALVKRIHSMERERSSDSNVEEELKLEASRFLNKMPIPQDESLNINFMVEELANRVKNRPKTPSPKRGKESGRRKSVVFDETVAYDDFSRVMPCCSSYSELPGTRPAQVNETPQSIYMRDATRSSIDYSEVIGNKPVPVRPILQCQNLAPSVEDSFHESQQQWLTLHESGAPTAAAAPGAHWSQQTRTYYDSASQSQVNQSDLCTSQMPAGIPQELVARQATCFQYPIQAQGAPQYLNQSLPSDHSLQQEICRSESCYQGQQQIPNQFSMQVQNVPQTAYQSVRFGQLPQQTCGTQIPCYGSALQIPNQPFMAVQNMPQQFNQSIPLDQLVQKATCRSFNGQEQVPMPVHRFSQQFTQSSIPQLINQSLKSDQQPQQACCGTQLSSQGPAHIQEQIQNLSIACQTPQSYVPVPRTPSQARIAGLPTSRGVLSTSQIPGPSGVPCNQIGPVNQIAPKQSVSVSTNQNVCTTGTSPHLSAFGFPVGHSTPHNAASQEILPRVIRKRSRELQRQCERARRQIDIEQPDEVKDDETDTDIDERCRCMARFRGRRRPMCSPYDGYNMNFPHFPMMFPYPYYF